MQTMTLAAAAAVLSATAVRADFDIAPAIVGGKIVTNAFSDAGPSAENDFTPYVPNVRVFDFALGEADEDGNPPADPFFTQDPGFHPQPGSGFTTGSNVRVSAVSGLSYYSGTGPVAFTSVAAGGDTLTYTYGTKSFTVGDTTPGNTAYADLGAANPAGDFDRHLESTLNGPHADGIYLVALQASDTGLNPTPSLPFYVLYGVNADDSIDAAKAYVRDTYAPGTNLAPVPEPAALGLFGLAGTALLRRKRTGRIDEKS